MNMHARGGHEDHAHLARTPSSQATGRQRRAEGPGVRHDGDRAVAAPCRARGPAVLLLQREVPGEVQRRAAEVPAARGRDAAPVVANAEAAPGTIYTCPMHPEIRQDHPGNCPKCGMTLEPVMPIAGRRREPGAGRLPAPLLVDAAADGRGHRAGDVRPPLRLVRHGHAELDRAACCRCRSCCGPAGRSSCAAVQSVINRSPNMWTLIGLGTGAAFVYSVVATVAPQLFPASFVSMGRVAVYFEAAAVIISLTLLGPDPGTEGALADLGRDQVAARPGAQDRAPHQRRRQRGRRAARPTCTSATCCACAPARRCRSTAWWSKAAARSTNRC